MILSLCFIPVIVFAIIKEKNLYNPCTIFTTEWLVIMFLTSLRLYGLNQVSSRAYLLAFLGVMCFALGCFARTMFRINVPKIQGLTTASNSGINYYLMIPLYLLAIAFTSVLARRSIGLILGGTPMSVIRTNYRNIESGLVVDSGLTYYLEQYFVTPMEFAATALLPIALFDKKSKEKFILLGEIAVFLTLHLFVTGARSFLIDVVLGLGVYTLMSRQFRLKFLDFLLKRRKKVPILLIVGVCIAAGGLVLVMSKMRKGGEVDMVRELYMYFSISLPLFDIHLDIMDKDPTFTFGFTLLNGLLRPFMLVLKKIDIGYPALYQTASTLLSDNNIFYSVGDTNANSFVTAFYSFYMDFGTAGTLLGCLFWGYFSQSLYQNMREQPSKRNQAVFILLTIGLFLSFARLLFTAYRYLYAFFILLFAFYNKKQDKLNDL